MTSFAKSCEVVDITNGPMAPRQHYEQKLLSLRARTCPSFSLKYICDHVEKSKHLVCMPDIHMAKQVLA